MLIYLKISEALFSFVVKHLGIFFDRWVEPSLCLSIQRSAPFDE